MLKRNTMRGQARGLARGSHHLIIFRLPVEKQILSVFCRFLSKDLQIAHQTLKMHRNKQMWWLNWNQFQRMFLFVVISFKTPAVHIEFFYIQYSELWFTIPQWLTSSKIEALTFTAWILRTRKCTSPLNNILCPKPLGMIFIWSHLKIEFRVCGFLFRPLFLNMMHKYFWIHRTPQIRFKRTSFCQQKRRQNGLQCPYCGIDVIPRITLSLSFELKQKRSKLFLKLKSSYF